MVTVIGAGLAGCEAAYSVAQQGIPVTLWEMKPHKYTPAHRHGGFAELVLEDQNQFEDFLRIPYQAYRHPQGDDLHLLLYRRHT